MERKSPISLEQLRSLVPSLCAKDTAAAKGDDWTPDNPTWGHCAVVSLLVQNLFGGELMRADLADTAFAVSRSHYFNRLPDGLMVDLTRDQFGDKLPGNLPVEPRTRDYVIGAMDTKPRYVEMAYRLAHAVSFGNRLFQNPVYARCLRLALASPCRKMGFGCIITASNGDTLAETYNAPADPLQSMCADQCTRNHIQSRTESMLGACAHAEESALWLAVKSLLTRGNTTGTRLSDLSVYVAGAFTNGMPYIKDVPEHTCLRCAVSLYLSGVWRVHIPVVDRWVPLTPEQCVETAKAYALGEKKI